MGRTPSPLAVSRRTLFRVVYLTFKLSPRETFRLTCWAAIRPLTHSARAMLTSMHPDVAELPAVTSFEQLRELVGQPSAAVRDKVRTQLHDLHRQWITASPLCFVATSAPDGSCDCSPKGDPPGFAKVLDETTIALPERAGNKRMDGYANLVRNPHVGLTFLIPGRGDTLRVNGIARLVTDGWFFEDMVVKGHRPLLAMVVDVQEVFFHCAKAFLRSGTWEPESWQPDAVPRHAVIAKTLVRPDESLEELEHYYGQVYSQGLYPQP